MNFRCIIQNKSFSCRLIRETVHNYKQFKEYTSVQHRFKDLIGYNIKLYDILITLLERLLILAKDDIQLGILESSDKYILLGEIDTLVRCVGIGFYFEFAFSCYKHITF